ncbi:response regulator [Desulfovibrio cuneatus]|uniref:response regulator n=1 Tax=Desulfovibrio cuneatus TaxID=159728 RepID=UPI0003FA3A3D|nr:response regulator [Desulfovibrio cuneatus]
MQAGTQKSVLIIDDEEDFAHTLAERLSLRNLAVQVACSGAEGLAFMEQNLPDALLLDMRMPAMSGIEVLRTVRQKYGMLPVLIITGHCSQEDHDRAQELGVQGYHSKPLDFKELFEQLVEVLHQK